MTALTEFRADQGSPDAQLRLVGADTSFPAAKDVAASTAAAWPGIQPEQPATDQSHVDSHQPTAGGWLLDPTLAMLADLVDDLENVRIATENRLRALTRGAADSDGKIRGLGLDERHPAVRRVTQVLADLRAAEHGAELALKASLRAHPLGPWMQAQVGIGEKQGARLLAAVGDPYWNSLHDRPRIVSELWAYCGLHVVPAGQCAGDAHTTSAGGDPIPGGGDTHRARDDQLMNGVAPARARGQKVNWNSDARKRCWLVATKCIMFANSPYRVVYDEGRAKYADAVHHVDCRRCGPKGKPALPGSPLSDGHKHARAIRLQMKAILKDLWSASRELYAAANASSPAAKVPAENHEAIAAGDSSPVLEAAA